MCDLTNSVFTAVCGVIKDLKDIDTNLIFML